MCRSFLATLVLLAGGCSTSIEPDPTADAQGPIAFGSAVNAATLDVEMPATSFRLTDEVAWSASLRAPVEGTRVNIVISKSGSDTELFGYEQFIPHPDATRLVNRMPLGRFLPDPGSYVMRYVTVAGDVVARGEFQLRR